MRITGLVITGGVLLVNRFYGKTVNTGNIPVYFGP
jgi:hypothetical protein